MIKKILTLTPNAIELDSRARRLDFVFRSSGYETKIISKSHNKMRNSERGRLPNSISKVLPKILKKCWHKYKASKNKVLQHALAPFMLVAYAIWIIYINILIIPKLKASVIIVHESIFTLSVIAAKKLYKARLIVDVHDYYNYIIEKNSQTPFDKYYRLKFDDYFRRILYSNSFLLLTVSNSLSKSLRNNYGQEFYVIKNIGNVFESNVNVIKKNSNRNADNNSNAKKGVFIGNYKNSIKSDWLKDEYWNSEKCSIQFTFIGNGYTQDFINQFNPKLVAFKGPIDFFVEKFDFNIYDFAFLPYESKGLANEFALPNGFFLLAQANLPLLIPKISEMSTINQKYNLGLESDFQCPESIASEIYKITSTEFISCRNIEEFNSDYNFELESKKFLDIISNLKIV
jgi:hypothetical protein